VQKEIQRVDMDQEGDSGGWAMKYFMKCRFHYVTCFENSNEGQIAALAILMYGCPHLPLA